MKLYSFDAAPNPARLKRFMDYKQIELDTTQINLGSEEQLGDAYKAIVPEATVPALVLDDGTVLCAVIAIVHYLEERFPDRRLTGTIDCSLRFLVQSRMPSEIHIQTIKIVHSLASPQSHSSRHSLIEDKSGSPRGLTC